MTGVKSAWIEVGGIATHYLEAGSGPHLILLHSGEFGACAELSWEHNIPTLAEHFHVLAPDWLGYGQTEKIFSFENMRKKREKHIADFLKAMQVDEADFVGNSMGGTELIAAANKVIPPWPLKKIVVVAGGGVVPNNDARKILNSYDCSREHMRRIIETMFVSEQIRQDEAYLERRFQLSLQPGAWECAAAPRFKAPHRVATTVGTNDYSNIRVPVLLVTGEKDSLREPDFGIELQRLVSGAQLYVVPNAGHCPQIEFPTLFNSALLEFLKAA